MKFTGSTNIAQVKPEEVQRFVDIALSQIAQILNGRLTPADNFDCNILTITFSSANTDVSASHTLGREPVGYYCIGSTTATTLYDGSSANTAGLIYLRATVATTARVLVF